MPMQLFYSYIFIFSTINYLMTSHSNKKSEGRLYQNKLTYQQI